MSDSTRTKDLTNLFETSTGQEPAMQPEHSAEPAAPHLPPNDFPGVEDLQESTISSEASAGAAASEAPLDAPSPSTWKSPEIPAIASAPPSSIAAETAPIGQPEIEAAYPFNLHIEGHLRPQERTALIDWLKSNSVGIREGDLDLQLQAGRIFLPRISEFVGISIIQLLRTAPVRCRLLPAPQESADLDWKRSELAAHDLQASPPTSDWVQAIPVFRGPTPPGLEHAQVLGAVQQTTLIELSSSGAASPHLGPDSKSLQDTIDRLTEALAMKAQHRQATHVVGLQIDVQAHGAPTFNRQTYRITVLGTALRAATAF